MVLVVARGTPQPTPTVGGSSGVWQMLLETGLSIAETYITNYVHEQLDAKKVQSKINTWKNRRKARRHAPRKHWPSKRSYKNDYRRKFSRR